MMLDSDGKDVTIFFMQKVEIILILMTCIFIMLCFLVIFGVIMLFHLCVKRRGRQNRTEECAGTCDQTYNQISDQMYQSTSDKTCHDNMSVYTVEMRGRHLHYNDSEHVYQDIREIVKDKSHMDYKLKNHNVEDKVGELMDKNSSEDKSINNYPKDVDKKPNLVYGMITAKEVARYVPVTQNVILR